MRALIREAMQKHNLTAKQFDQLSIEEFGAPYGEKGAGQTSPSLH